MKYGAHCYLFVERWSDSQLHLLDLAKELGLDMFELSVGDDVVFDAVRTGERAASLGLDLLIGPGGAWPLECDLSADEQSDRAKGLAWHKRQVDVAAALGAAAYAGALYGHPGVVKRRRPPADEYKWTADGLHELAEYASKRNVAIVLEPMSHFRTHMVNTTQQLLCLLDLARHPNLSVLFDTYHVVTEIRDYPAAIRSVGSRLYALHACENDRGVPGGGLIPWLSIFKTLHGIGFNGYIGLEGYNSGLGDFAFQRGMFHNVCPDGPAFVRQGIGFLRDMEARTRQ
ncbi:sugar phosphate isomerase/epimerase [bacterium]|nr:MAG: sugar phosphate isomerase/epimerase [bacterium]